MESLLCLSSGLTPQYRQDILRLLALPKGSAIQFRYGQELIEAKLRAELEQDRGIGTTVLLAYVNCNRNAARIDETCPIEPCRYGIVRRSRLVGTHFILEFELGAFALGSDAEAFQKKLPPDRPHWIKTSDKAVGLWCFETTISGLMSDPADSTGAWEKIVTRLYSSEDFSEEKLFFRFTGLRELDASTDFAPKQTKYSLGSGKNYEFSIYHFHPDRDDAVMDRRTMMIEVQVSNPLIEMVSTSSLPIDSPYDLKTFRFHTAVTTGRQHGLITVRIEDRAIAKAVETQPELYLPTEVKAAVLKPLLFTGLLTALLAGQQLLTIWATKPPLTEFTVGGTILLALFTAAIAVYGLKKPI